MDVPIEPEEKKKENEEVVTPRASDDDEASSSIPTSNSEDEIAGIIGWNRPGGMAYGSATSLYERHPVSGDTAGNPVADV